MVTGNGLADSVARMLAMRLLAGLFCFAASGQTLAQQLHLSDKIVAQAKLRTLSESGWVFDTQPTVPSDAIVRWGTWPGILKQQATWLADGSWLVGELQIQRNGTILEVDSDWLQVPPIDLASVRGLVVAPPASPSKWSELQRRMAAVDGGQDVVWLLNQQRVAGVVRWRTRPGSEWVDRLVLDSGNYQTEIMLAEVQAIVFSPALLGPLPVPTGTTIGLNDGTLLSGCELRFSKDHAIFKLAQGMQLPSLDAVAEMTSSVCYLSGKPEGVQFLSDLAPASYRNLSDNKLMWELGVDRDLYGKPLRQQEGFVNKGLALHSSSQVAYRWDGSDGRFLAEVSLAPPEPMSSASLGSVNCQVFVARKGELQLQREFSLSRSRSSSSAAKVNVDVDLAGAQLIVLVVEKSDFGQYADQVFWLDTRLFKNP